MTTITVSADIWSAASQEERDQIKAILVAAKLIEPEDEIVGDANTPPVYESDEAADVEDDASVSMMGVGALSACKAACKAARDAARAACGIAYPFSSSKRRNCREAVEHARRACVAACELAGD